MSFHAVIPRTFEPFTTADADEVNEVFDYLYDYYNTHAVHLDGTVRFDAGVLPNCAARPTTANQWANKDYADQFVHSGGANLPSIVAFDYSEPNSIWNDNNAPTAPLQFYLAMGTFYGVTFTAGLSPFINWGGGLTVPHGIVTVIATLANRTGSNLGSRRLETVGYSTTQVQFACGDSGTAPFSTDVSFIAVIY